jgi:hypothetical protein
MSKSKDISSKKQGKSSVSDNISDKNVTHTDPGSKTASNKASSLGK